MLIVSLKSLPKTIPEAVDAIELRLDLNPSLRHFKTDKPLIIKSDHHQDAKLGEYFDCDWQSAPPKGVKIICSRHMDHTPQDLFKTFDELRRAMPAHIYKLACVANSTLDALRMLIATRALAQAGIKVIGLCMGELGQITRIAGPITYAYSADPTAPGQLSVDELTQIYRYPRSEEKWYGLLGDPIEQSPSHLTHNPHCFFLKMRIKAHEFSDSIALIEQLPFHGLAVTIPHKGDPPINTYVRAKTGWSTHNTDGLGALDVLGDVKHKRIALLGDGGCSKAIAKTLREQKARVNVYNRTPKPGTLPLSQVGGYDILINATSCGMLSLDCPIKQEQVLPNTTIFETICKPKETTLLRYAKEKKCRIHSGEEMFIAQANRQFKIWGLKTSLQCPRQN